MSDTFAQVLSRLPQIAEALVPFDTEPLKLEVLRALLASIDPGSDQEGPLTPSVKTASNNGGTRKSRSRSKVSIGLDKQLDLSNPAGISFKTFAEEAAPRNNQEKLLTAVYWLESERLPEAPVTVEQVVTCFNHMSWRQPTNPRNALAVVASEKGWLDTSNASDLRVTISGKNRVEHDMRSQNGR
ncbi:MAG: hypothetical protein M9934_02540 [Thermomicrobiales bacterium]|nr:hypothetical protein [Thermomicrobiales bacterium]MCO5227150.1 hypothetical protein [Thermomicrobiales bacterium]